MRSKKMSAWRRRREGAANWMVPSATGAVIESASNDGRTGEVLTQVGDSPCCQEPKSEIEGPR